MEKTLSIFQQALKKIGLTRDDRILLAVSGGLDSVVLTACAAMSGVDFGIAHANFQLRGDESQRDEDFVRSLAKSYGSPFFVQCFDTMHYAEQQKCSIQVAARNLRYDWFKSLMGVQASGFKYLFTGHHLDDNIETMLINFFRGTGIRGLEGMPERTDWLFRPLLSVPRQELERFATAERLSWVEDSSNAKDDYTRNQLRNQIIPALVQVLPDLQSRMIGNLIRFSETAVLFEQAVLWHKKRLVKKQGKEYQIPILLLKKTNPLHTVLYEIVKDFEFNAAQVTDIIRILDGSNGKYVSSATHRIIKNRNWLIIALNEDAESAQFIVEKNNQSVFYPQGTLVFLEAENGQINLKQLPEATECLNADKIEFPLILRKWKAGDYFYPLGMKKKKKIARFLIDQKLSKTAKENVWVLIQDNQIIYVVGHRIDNRFAVTAAGQKMLLITKTS